MYSLLYAATNGAFDIVPLEKIEIAKDTLLRELKAKHEKVITAVNTGDKPTDAQNETILKVATTIADSYGEKKPMKEAATK